MTATIPQPTSTTDQQDDYGVSAEPDWRSVDWQDHLRQTQIAGRRVNYVDLGAGDATPIVFVHGLAGCWQVWLENLPYFARSRRVVALDLPGFGHSEPPADELSISGYGRVVDALCEQLGLDEVVLAGNSMGGFVSIETALQFPRRVERLVLNSSVGFAIHDRRRSEVKWWAIVTGAATKWQAARLEEVVARPRLRELFFRDIVRHPERIAPDLLYEISTGNGKPAYRSAVEAFAEYDVRHRIEEIGVPTLIVWGKSDRLVPAGDADRFEEHIEHSTKLVMPDTGHYAMVERPRAFNAAVEEFLAGELPAS